MLSRNLFDKIRCIFFSVLKKFSVIIFVAVLAGVSMDIVRTGMYRPVYQSELSAIVMASNQKFEQLDETRSYIRAMEYIFNGDYAKKYVRDKMKNPDLEYNCTITSEDDSNFVTIKVTSDQKQNSYYALKNLLRFNGENRNIYTADYHLKVFKSAKFNPDPVNSNSHSVNFVLGSVAGGFLTAAYFALIEILKKRVRCENDIQEYIASRMFATIPKEKKSEGSRRFWEKNKKGILVTSLKTSFEYREAIKKLRHRFESNARKHGYKSLLVTSANENEGKSTILTNLAIALTMREKKVLLMDMDIIKPSVHQILEISNAEKNINNYLRGDSDWRSQLQEYSGGELYILTSEKINENPEAVFEDEKLKNLLKEAEKEFDYILIDCAPSGNLNDAVILNKWVDASLLVIRQNTALCSNINETIFRLKNANDNLIGCIYNERMRKLNFKKKAYRYGYYGGKNNE